MEQVAFAQIPTSFYIIIGVLVIGNVGVLLTMISFIFKAGMFVSETKNGIADAHSTAVQAHKRIDLIESRRGI